MFAILIIFLFLLKNIASISKYCLEKAQHHLFISLTGTRCVAAGSSSYSHHHYKAMFHSSDHRGSYHHVTEASCSPGKLSPYFIPGAWYRIIKPQIALKIEITPSLPWMQSLWGLHVHPMLFCLSHRSPVFSHYPKHGGLIILEKCT